MLISFIKDLAVIGDLAKHPAPPPRLDTKITRKQRHLIRGNT